MSRLSLAAVLTALYIAGAYAANPACVFGPTGTVPCDATVGGQTYTVQQMQGFGQIPGSAVDDTGNTIGGIGSAISIAPGTWKKNADGSYAGTLFMQPDRGHNSAGAATVDYQARKHTVDFTFTPYTGSAAGAGANSLKLNYASTQVYIDSFTGEPVTGLDPNALRPAEGTSPISPIGGPTFNNQEALTYDAEGLAVLCDGSFYVADEYGPYLFFHDASGVRQATLNIPEALVPHSASGAFQFNTLVNGIATDPASGRVPNQGFEGLTLNADQTRLYALLQSATIQDGGSSNTKGRNTRLVEFDISQSLTNPPLVGEYAVALPFVPTSATNASPSTTVAAQSEMLYLSPTTFLVLARDGRGNGNGNPPSQGGASSTVSRGKNAGIIDISAATNFAANTAANAVAGTIPAGAVEAQWTPFTELTIPSELARFGLTNGATTDAQLPTAIVGKFESLALVSALDAANPNDYFLFTAADNDFITANGEMNPPPTTFQDSYAVQSGQNVPNQVFVFRVTLPGTDVVNTCLNAAAVAPSARARVKARAMERRAKLIKRAAVESDRV